MPIDHRRVTEKLNSALRDLDDAKGYSGEPEASVLIGAARNLVANAMSIIAVSKPMKKSQASAAESPKDVEPIGGSTDDTSDDEE